MYDDELKTGINSKQNYRHIQALRVGTKVEIPLNLIHEHMDGNIAAKVTNVTKHNVTFMTEKGYSVSLSMYDCLSIKIVEEKDIPEFTEIDRKKAIKNAMKNRRIEL